MYKYRPPLPGSGLNSANPNSNLPEVELIALRDSLISYKDLLIFTH